MNVSEIKPVNESLVDQDMFDLDKGDFEDHSGYNEKDQEENMQIYQMYDELCNIVSENYNPDGHAAISSDEESAVI